MFSKVTIRNNSGTIEGAALINPRHIAKAVPQNGFGTVITLCTGEIFAISEHMNEDGSVGMPTPVTDTPETSTQTSTETEPGA